MQSTIPHLHQCVVLADDVQPALGSKHLCILPGAASHDITGLKHGMTVNYMLLHTDSAIILCKYRGACAVLGGGGRDSKIAGMDGEQQTGHHIWL